jgi:hypothetical protein
MKTQLAISTLLEIKGFVLFSAFALKWPSPYVF